MISYKPPSREMTGGFQHCSVIRGHIVLASGAEMDQDDWFRTKQSADRWYEVIRK